MANAAESKTWAQRMAEELADKENPACLILAALEAAAEIKAVRLKVLIGRCYEILGAAKNNGGVPCMDEDFLTELIEAIQ